jgi:Heterokaryon incompatibility protein (HET)
MWLVNTDTLQLEYFISSVAQYVILSHTWGPEEISFQEFNIGTSRDSDGYRKIVQATRVAKEMGYKYIWIDTCCIDKTSSSELSEAINSMFEWYMRSTVCIALLSDVSVKDQQHPHYPTVSTLGRSRWFTRGWTLQELIAPRDVIFYSKEWEVIGDRFELAGLIAEVTRIDKHILIAKCDEANQWAPPLDKYSIAQRMSWAAGRQTTRNEDQAYCLMGIFHVNMPLLYGERHNAFQRLQEEILKTSHDQSIFAWSSKTRSYGSFCGILAQSPNDFALSHNISSFSALSSGEPVTVSSKGVRARLYLVPSGSTGLYEAYLECYVGEDPKASPVIFIAEDSRDPSRDPFDHQTWKEEIDSRNVRFVRFYGETLQYKNISFTENGRYAHVWVGRSLQEKQGIPPAFESHTFFKIHNYTDFNITGIPKRLWDPRFQTFSFKSSEQHADSKLGVLLQGTKPGLIRDKKLAFLAIIGHEGSERQHSDMPSCAIIDLDKNQSAVDHQKLDQNELMNILKNYSFTGFAKLFDRLNLGDEKYLLANLQTDLKLPYCKWVLVLRIETGVNN